MLRDVDVTDSPKTEIVNISDCFDVRKDYTPDLLLPTVLRQAKRNMNETHI